MKMNKFETIGIFLLILLNLLCSDCQKVVKDREPDSEIVTDNAALHSNFTNTQIMITRDNKSLSYKEILNYSKPGKNQSQQQQEGTY